MKKPKRANATKAKKGRKGSGSRAKAVPKSAPKRSTGRQARPAPRGAGAAVKKAAKRDVKRDVKNDATSTVRSLRTKLSQAMRRIDQITVRQPTDVEQME